MQKVSVIVPCYNATKWLPKCFLSLVSQTIGMENLELIFVDDASTDGGATWFMLQEFERAYPQQITIIQLEGNMRQGGARNVALQHAVGEYVAFVDSDDFVAENFLEKTYLRAKATDADIVQFEYSYYTEKLGSVTSGRQVKEEVIRIQTEQERKSFLMSEKITYGCWNKLYRRELLLQAGVKYAEHVIYEEPLFVYPLLFYGHTYVIMNDVYYFYRQNEQGTMYRDMKDMSTLRMHMLVQLKVWQFMKKTPFFKDYYEEIKLYFLHSYFYETLYFAKQRGFEIPWELYLEMEKTIKDEVPDYDRSEYATLIPKQMELYKLVRSGMEEQLLQNYMQTLWVAGGSDDKKEK